MQINISFVIAYKPATDKLVLLLLLHKGSSDEQNNPTIYYGTWEQLPLITTIAYSEKKDFFV
jgi:hypothetical protein